MTRRRSIQSLLMVPLVTSTLLVGLAACVTGTVGSGAGGSGGSDGSGGTGGTPKYTLDNVCAQIAPQLCAARSNCCLSSGAYDEAGCLAFETAQCEKNVADVKAGVMTFDGNSIDACAAALQPYADKCFLTIPDYYDAPTDLAPCAKVFAGTLPAGSACERDAQCQSSLGEKEIVRCDGGTNKCSALRFLPSGAACGISTTATEFCDKGLFCDADVLTLKGTCKPATPVGGACQLNVGGFSLQCGLGYYCDAATLVCTDAKGKDAPCALLLDCQSLKCTNNLCEGVDPLYGKQQCTGMP